MNNINNYLSTVFVMLVAMIFISCGSKHRVVSLQPTVTENVTTTIEEVKRDTTLIVFSDKSQYVAELAVQGNKIVVKDANIKHSNNKALQPPKVQLQDNKLIVDCEVEAQELFFEWRDKFIKEYKLKEVKIPVPVPLELSRWQTLQIWLGRGFIFLVASGTIFLYIIQKRK